MLPKVFPASLNTRTYMGCARCGNVSCTCPTICDCNCKTKVGYYKFESFDKDRDDLVKKLDELLKELKRWNTKE